MMFNDSVPSKFDQGFYSDLVYCANEGGEH
jgi:hypothetical protein